MTTAQPNPLFSYIKDITLGGFSIYKTANNAICRFEKLEMIESVFELFPSGSVIVRDVSDVITYIKNNNITSLTITTDNGVSQTYFITSTNFITNAASETEENFVAINFSNFIFKENQNITTNEILSVSTPTEYDIDEIIENVSNGVGGTVVSSSPFSFYNTIVYKNINPLEEKIDVITSNPIQYINYVSSLACDESTKLPRYLLWTGFDDTVNVKYFYQNVNNDTAPVKRYAIYSADIPTAKFGGSVYKKIYLFTTSPADQYLNKNYYYIRKTPKILNRQTNNSLTDITQRLFNHQYLDDGAKYDIEIVTSQGVVDSLPNNSGISLLEYDKHYGYYTKNDTNTNFSSSNLLSLEYGNRKIYESQEFYSSNQYPFIDNPEMWKNIWDLTPIHPNLESGPASASNSKLQQILSIRKNSQSDEDKLQQIHDIELQNFIYYVLCCLTPQDEIIQQEEEEETFFACVTGWREDPEYTSTSTAYGAKQEPLIYRYSWNRLAVNIDESNLENFDYFTNPENGNVWSYTDEKSAEIQDDPNLLTWAINVNERKNYYVSTNANSSYYAPGWYTKNLTETLFSEVRYKPVGHKGGDTFTSTTQTQECYFIVQMKKIPYFKLIKESNNYNQIVTSQEIEDELRAAAQGKYFYSFEMANITDGKCTVDQQGQGQ